MLLRLLVITLLVGGYAPQLLAEVATITRDAPPESAGVLDWTLYRGTSSTNLQPWKTLSPTTLKVVDDSPPSPAYYAASDRNDKGTSPVSEAVLKVNKTPNPIESAYDLVTNITNDGWRLDFKYNKYNDKTKFRIWITTDAVPYTQLQSSELVLNVLSQTAFDIIGKAKTTWSKNTFLCVKIQVEVDGALSDIPEQQCNHIGTKWAALGGVVTPPPVVVTPPPPVTTPPVVYDPVKVPFQYSLKVDVKKHQFILSFTFGTCKKSVRLWRAGTRGDTELMKFTNNVLTYDIPYDRYSTYYLQFECNDGTRMQAPWRFYVPYE